MTLGSSSSSSSTRSNDLSVAAEAGAAASRSVLRVKRLSPAATIPVKGSPGSAGFDLASAERTVIRAGDRGVVRTDLSIACPPGTYGRIAPRSGLAVKKFVDVGAGVVDADYRGPVGVVLFNFGSDDLEIEVGDRVAQLVLEKIDDAADAVEVNDLDDTERGAGGFGSTGVSTTTTIKPPPLPSRLTSTPRNKHSDNNNVAAERRTSVSNTLAFQATVSELLAIVHGMEEIRLAPEAFRLKVKRLALTRDPALVAAVAAYGVTEDPDDFMETLELIVDVVDDGR